MAGVAFLSKYIATYIYPCLLSRFKGLICTRFCSRWQILTIYITSLEGAGSRDYHICHVYVIHPFTTRYKWSQNDRFRLIHMVYYTGATQRNLKKAEKSFAANWADYFSCETYRERPFVARRNEINEFSNYSVVLIQVPVYSTDITGFKEFNL